MLDKDIDDGAAPTGVFASDEHPVFVAELGGADRVWVLVSQSAPSIKVNISLFKACCKLGAFLLGVEQRFPQWTLRSDVASRGPPRNLQESVSCGDGCTTSAVREALKKW